MKLEPMLHSDAVALFKHLVKTYGTNWTILVPEAAHRQLRQCSRALSVAERRSLLEELAKENG